MDKAKSYIEMPKLTPELLRVFIRRIEVYEKPEKYSRTCGTPIIIHYAFQLPEQKRYARHRSPRTSQRQRLLKKQSPEDKMPSGDILHTIYALTTRSK